MYADRITPSMEEAIDETNRRRDIQIAWNTEHGIDPKPLQKRIADITDMLAREDADTAELLGSNGARTSPVPREVGQHTRDLAALPSEDLGTLVQELTEQMHAAAADLQFEVAARLRDEISELKKELRQMLEATK